MTKPSMSLPRYREDCGGGSRSLPSKLEAGAGTDGRAASMTVFTLLSAAVLKSVSVATRGLRRSLARDSGKSDTRTAAKKPSYGSEISVKRGETAREPPRRRQGASRAHADVAGSRAPLGPAAEHNHKRGPGDTAWLQNLSASCKAPRYTLASGGPIDSQAAACAGACPCMCSRIPFGRRCTC